MAGCCPCCPTGTSGSHTGPGQSGLPLICLVPRAGPSKTRPATASANGARSDPTTSNLAKSSSEFQLLEEEYIRKHFKVPERAMYLDAFRRPLITFPIQEDNTNFNIAKKTKINQMILDGSLDAREAICAPSVFPFGKSGHEKRKEAKEDEEIIYILQLPDYEFTCPAHNQTIRTPRFIWHSCKKESKKDDKAMKQGGGPLNKPKPWLLSRHTDFDLQSQW